MNRGVIELTATIPTQTYDQNKPCDGSVNKGRRAGKSFLNDNLLTQVRSPQIAPKRHSLTQVISGKYNSIIYNVSFVMVTARINCFETKAYGSFHFKPPGDLAWVLRESEPEHHEFQNR